MQFLSRIERIADFYGHQHNMDDAFGLLKEYVEGNLLYEVSHVVVNKELYIQIKSCADACFLFASYDHKLDYPNRYTYMVLVNQQQADYWHGLSRRILELPIYEHENKGIMIDGIWDSLMIYGAKLIGYKWGEEPSPPYHTLQQFVNSIYRILPCENGHLIDHSFPADPLSQHRYQGLG